jgi:hypothetical protein
MGRRELLDGVVQDLVQGALAQIGVGLDPDSPPCAPEVAMASRRGDDNLGVAGGMSHEPFPSARA